MDIFQPLKKYSRYREIHDELSSRSDRQLHDMGMTREKIKEIAKAATRR